MLKIYAVFYSGPCVGTDNMELIVAKSETEAVDLMWDTACDWYQNWTNEDDYDEDGNLIDGPDVWAEVYDPEKHDGLHPGGPPSEKYIDELKKQLK
jgi:hypothetical protein